MPVNMKNPISDLRKNKGYSIEQLSVISGLTVLEINMIESGELTDRARVARLMNALGN